MPLSIEKRPNREPQYKGVYAHGTPSAHEPGWIAQAGAIGLPPPRGGNKFTAIYSCCCGMHSPETSPNGHPVQRLEDVTNQIYICGSVGGTVPASSNNDYSAFNLGEVPKGCTITAVTVNGNDSVDGSADFQVGLGLTPAVLAPFPPGFGTDQYPFTTVILGTQTSTLNTGVAQFPNTPVTETTGCYVVLQWTTAVGNVIGPTTGNVTVKISYICA